MSWAEVKKINSNMDTPLDTQLTSKIAAVVTAINNKKPTITLVRGGRLNSGDTVTLSRFNGFLVISNTHSSGGFTVYLDSTSGSNYVAIAGGDTATIPIDANHSYILNLSGGQYDQASYLAYSIS